MPQADVAVVVVLVLVLVVVLVVVVVVVVWFLFVLLSRHPSFSWWPLSIFSQARCSCNPWNSKQTVTKS